MNNISVAIATYNEEENIGRCLESVKDWVGEIVLVDGSSTDNTVEIAKKYKAKIIITDNPKIFHINKQKAIAKCQGKWILQLDADEIVTEELRKEILNIINPQLTTPRPRPARGGHNTQQVNGYWIPRKNYFLGKWLSKGGQYPDYTLRLYKNGRGRLPGKSVHEQAEVDGPTGYLKSPLLHYPYADFAEYLQHFNRYTDIFASEYQKEKPGISPLSFINYMLIKPVIWFLLSFVRHKGFVDGFPGFIFSFFSSLRFPASYIKYLKTR